MGVWPYAVWELVEQSPWSLLLPLVLELKVRRQAIGERRWVGSRGSRGNWTVWGGGRICKEGWTSEGTLTYLQGAKSRARASCGSSRQPLGPGGEHTGLRAGGAAAGHLEGAGNAVVWPSGGSLWSSTAGCEWRQRPGPAPTFWAQKENSDFISAFWIANKISLLTQANCARRRTPGNLAPALLKWQTTPPPQRGRRQLGRL